MFLKYLLKAMLFIFSILITYIMVSFIIILFTDKHHHVKYGKEIYIYYDEVHTEIIMKTSYFNKEFSNNFPNLIKNNNGFIAFSFGDRDFFMEVPNWEDIKIGVSLKSLFRNTPALMRVSQFRYINQDACKKIYINDKRLKALKKSILNSFEKKHNKFIKYDDHYKETGTNYYQACEPYNLFYTCNSWTGDKLKDANITQPLITPFAQQVIYPF